MQIKLDENMSIAHAEFLRQAGYDCDRVTDEGLSGADDEIVWQQACTEGRFFITLDLDFSDVRLFPQALIRVYYCYVLAVAVASQCLMCSRVLSASNL